MRLFHSFILSLCLFFSSSQLFAAQSDSVAVGSSEAVKVNINTADFETLSLALKGVGPSKARAIIAYRESYGPFSSADELVEVKGIGEALLSVNRGAIVTE